MRKYILFGSGKRAERILKALANIELAFVIDNDPEKWGKEVAIGEKTYLISNPGILKSITPQGLEIIIGSTYTGEMLAQVEELVKGRVNYCLTKYVIASESTQSLKIYSKQLNDRCEVSHKFESETETVVFSLGTEPVCIRVNSVCINGEPSADLDIIRSNGDWADGDILSFPCKNPNIYFEKTDRLESVSVSFEFKEADYKAAYEFSCGYIKALSDVSNNINPEFVPEEDLEPVVFGDGDVKPIAYYLPQFHQIPQNDEWWEKGFTEWTNVTKTYPLFEGHYQPHLPIDMGFYDLNSIEVQKRQIELAKKYGVYGFCYYYYHYEEGKLLDMPIRRHVENNALDFPFCVMWVTSNWTKSWIGQNRTVLQKLGNSKEFFLKVIKGLSTLLKDPRYIRVGGRPLVIIYNTKNLDDANMVSRLWRDYCADSGIGEIYLLQTDALGENREIGFDGVAEFFQHSEYMMDTSYKLRFYREGVKGRVVEYPSDPKIQYFLSDSLVYRRVSPSWDNTPRYDDKGPAVIFHNTTPQKYKNWLEAAIGYSKCNQPLNDRYVFIDAWNEWAEGAHLEPDRRYGYAYLKATRDAILDSRGADISDDQK